MTMRVVQHEVEDGEGDGVALGDAVPRHERKPIAAGGFTNQDTTVPKKLSASTPWVTPRSPQGFAGSGPCSLHCTPCADLGTSRRGGTAQQRQDVD